MKTSPLRKRPLWTKALYTLLFVAAFCGLLISVLPLILSTSWGKGALVRYLNKGMTQKIDIQEISLSWFGPQELSGLTVADPQHGLYADIDKIESNASLFAVLSKDHNVGDLTVRGADIKIKKELQVSHRPKKPEFSRAAAFLLPSFDMVLARSFFPVTGNLQLAGAKVELLSAGVDPIVFDGIEGSLFLAKDRSRVTLSLQAGSLQGAMKGGVQLEAFLSDVNTNTPSFSTKTDITNFPVKGLDQILALFHPGYRGLVIEALGPSLTLSLKGSLSQSNLDLNLNASSQNFKAAMQTQASGSLISLKGPATFTLAISPVLVHKALSLHPALSALSLMQNAAATWTISQFSLPLLANELDIANLAFDSTLSFTPLPVQVNKGEPFTIAPLNIRIQSKGLAAGIGFSLSSLVESSSVPAKIDLTGQLVSPLSPSLSVKIAAEIDQFPSALVDGAAGSAVFQSALGKTFSLKAHANMGSDQKKVTFSMSSPTATLPTTKWKWNGKWELEEPFTLTFSPSRELYALLFHKELLAAASHPLQFNVEALSFSNVNDLRVKASLQSSLLSFEKAFIFSPYNLENVSLLLNVDTLNKISVDLASSRVALNFEAGYNLTTNTLTLKRPLTGSYLFTEEQLAALNLGPNRPSLASPSRIGIEIDPISLPLDGRSLKDISLKGVATIDSLELQSQAMSTKALFTNSKARFDFGGKSGVLTLKASSQFSDGTEKPGVLSIDCTLDSFMEGGALRLSNANLDTRIEIQKLSSKLIETLLSQKRRLEPLIGANIDLKAYVKASKNSRSLSIDASSSRLMVKGALEKKNDLITLQQSPFILSLDLTPDGYMLLDSLLTSAAEGGAPPFSLLEEALFTCRLTDLYLPAVKVGSLPDPFEGEKYDKIDLMHMRIKGKIETKKLSFIANGSEQTVSLQDASLDFSKDASTAFVVNMSAGASAKAPKGSLQEGTLAIQGSFDKFFTTDGALDFSKVSSNINLSVQKMPSVTLDLFSRLAGKTNAPFSTLFGPYFNASFEAGVQNATGPVKLNINSPNTRASLVGTLTGGTLTLSEPIYGQLTLTPEMSSLFLKELNPLGITSISSKNPLTIEVSPKGFSFPVTNFSLEKVSIPDAQLELGRINCKNEGNLSIALGLLKSDQIAPSQTLNLWFAPIVFHMNAGRLDLERSEILVADLFDIALWGKVNFIQNQVDMILGLTAPCLRQAFGIKNLPEDYVLHIPMTGTLGDIKIDKGKATAKIAALLVWQQKSIAGDAIGGQGGALFNQFLNKLGSLPLNSEPTPPARRPFPWEVDSAPKKKATAPKKKTHIKPKDKPLKQIYKIVK